MTTALVHYDRMRQEVAHCARIDEAAELRDKAAALAAYARQREDTELDVWMSEIRLRACRRIGELSMELETAERMRTDLHPSNGKQTKTDALTEAGLSTTTANRYEELAGGREEQMRAVGTAAAESYFAKASAEQRPGTMEGLRGAIRKAVRDTFGDPPPKSARHREPPNPLEEAFVLFAGAVQRIAECDQDASDLASCAQPRLIEWHREHCRLAMERLRKFDQALGRKDAA